MRPCGATRAGTQAPPLHISIIFFRAIPHKQNNHLHAIHPNEINRLRIIHPNETVGAVPVCPPERSHSGVSIQKIHALCTDVNDECAPAGRHGRAHRHRPYQSPSYFSTQSHTNKITIYVQSSPTTSTVPCAIHPNETVGAVPMCPPEHPHSGVSISKMHALCAGDERWMRPCRAPRAGT